MRIYSKSSQTAHSVGEQEWPQVAQARKMSFRLSKCENMFSLRNGYIRYSKFVVDFL